MAVPVSLLPELEKVIRDGSPERLAVALERITTLFLGGASNFNEDHLHVFDDVFGSLIEEIETKARAELSGRLAPVGNAPMRVMRRLAYDDEISVARPALEQSPRLTDSDLVEIAKFKSQAHLLAISVRTRIGEPVTDVLIRRGDSTVVRSVAQNRGARLSEGGFSSLVYKAGYDGVLAEKVGLRSDLPPHLFRELLLRATEVVQQRLLVAAAPDKQAEIRRVLAKISGEVAARSGPRDFTAARRTVEALRLQGRLDEAQLLEFAKATQYEEMVAALSQLCSVPIEVVDRLMGGDRPDPVLILCKSAGWGWSTVKTVIMARPGVKAGSSQGLDNAFSNFERLSSATAQRVMRFWQARQPATAEPPR